MPLDKVHRYLPENCTLIDPALDQAWQELNKNGPVGQNEIVTERRQRIPMLTRLTPMLSALVLGAAPMLIATQSVAQFVTETVVSARVGLVSLALDAQGNPRIAYLDVSPEEPLKFVSRGAAGWTTPEIVDFGWGSLALDDQGNPRIAYLGVPDDHLKFASKDDGAGWKIETADAAGDVGKSASLALDAEGNPRIAYYDQTPLGNNQIKGDLKFAWKDDSAGWKTEIVDAAGDVGKSASLALDAEGNPRIAYYDQTPLGNNQIKGDLKFAWKDDGASWKTEIVDAAGNVGEWASLALNAQGNPSIAYYDQTNGDLKFVSKVAGSWTTPKTMDSASELGSPLSLALDAQGNPHIAYNDNTNQVLKYARFVNLKKIFSFATDCKPPCLVLGISDPHQLVVLPTLKQAVLVLGGQIRGVRVERGMLTELYVQPGSSVIFYSDEDEAPDIKLTETTERVGFLGIEAAPKPPGKAPIITGLALRQSGTGSELVGVVFSSTELQENRTSK